jgi:acetyl esterase/lipase
LAAVVSALALLVGAAPAPIYRGDVHCGPGPTRVFDVGRLATRSGAARPAVVFVHGGGWAAGSRADWGGALPRIVALGWVALSIDYRFSAPVTDTLARARLDP